MCIQYYNINQNKKNQNIKIFYTKIKTSNVENQSSQLLQQQRVFSPFLLYTIIKTQVENLFLEQEFYTQKIIFTLTYHKTLPSLIAFLSKNRPIATPINIPTIKPKEIPNDRSNPDKTTIPKTTPKEEPKPMPILV